MLVERHGDGVPWRAKDIRDIRETGESCTSHKGNHADNTQGSKFGGAWTAKDHTTLLLVFDNAYSLVTAKDVAVAVSVRSATYRPAEESLSAMAEYRKEWRELHTDSKV